MSQKVKTTWTGYETGSVGNRFIAIVIDGFILSLITGILFGIGREVGGGIGAVMTVVYNWYFWTRWEGQTPGKRMMGLRVVKADGSQLSDLDAVIRSFGYYISGLFFGLGYLWAFIDSKQRTWHDMLAGTVVIRAGKKH